MYYPKSQITPNLYSDGKLYLSTTLQPYFGYYFETSDGKSFTGKEPNDGDNLRLITPELEADQDIFTPGIEDLRFTRKNKKYSILTNNVSPLTNNFPIPFTPQPTKGDYQTGEITRFFAKKRNENIYHEVENSNVDSNPMYFTFSLQWLISGEESYVSTTNQKMVELYMRQLPIPLFNIFLKNNYTKFWEPS
jgi:hypothetical protein